MKTQDLVLIGAGIALYFVGVKTFSEYHEDVAQGSASSFQHRHATMIGSLATLGGLGLAVYGTYKLNATWGKLLGAGLGSVIVYNAYKHQKGEPLISLKAPLFGQLS
jgi:hypothetical protein